VRKKILEGYEPFAEDRENRTRQNDTIQNQNKTNTKQKRVVADSPGFEPGTEAPEASVLSRLYYESS
jgi:hypothetical protein